MKNIIWVFLAALFLVVGTVHYMGLTQEAVEQRNWEIYRDVNSCKYVTTVPGTFGRLNGRRVYVQDREIYRCVSGEVKERPVRD